MPPAKSKKEREQKERKSQPTNQPTPKRRRRQKEKHRKKHVYRTINIQPCPQPTLSLSCSLSLCAKTEHPENAGKKREKSPTRSLFFEVGGGGLVWGLLEENTKDQSGAISNFKKSFISSWKVKTSGP